MSYGDNPRVFRMDATGPLNLAIERARYMLFRPFDLARWLPLGLIILLDVLVSGGNTFNFNFPSGNQGAPWEGHNWEEIWPFVVIGIAVLFLVLLPLGGLLTWLSSRGQLMFVRAVALNDTAIGDNWRASAKRGWSLFLFRLVFGLLSFLFLILVVGAAVAAIILLQEVTPWFVIVLLAALVGVPVMVALGVVHVLLRSFVAPIMWRYDLPAMEAWRVFLPLLRVNKGPVLLFIVIRLAYSIAFGIVSMIVGCMTCCIGFLPYVHHVVFAPYYVFDRAYSLYMLESLGPDYQMIATPVPPGAPVMYGEPVQEEDAFEEPFGETEKHEEHEEPEMPAEEDEEGEPEF